MSALTDRLLELLPDLRLHHEAEDDKEVMVNGSPGTGKTRSLGAIVEAHISAGLAPDQMLINAFTRNATAELKGRLSSQYGLTETEMLWVRTIHSSCFRLLQLRPEQVVSYALLKEFGESSGYNFKGVLNQRSMDDPYSVGAIDTFGDWCYVAEELRRALTVSIPEIVQRLHRKNPTDHYWGEDEAQTFSEAYRDWKRGVGLFDYADMLEQVLRHRLRPAVRWIFTDESQDMTPAQWRVVEMWSEDADRLMVFADSDQAIFGFAGADPNELLKRPGHKMFLAHSYRLGSNILSEARGIIRRLPPEKRAPEGWEPHFTGGSVDRLFGWADSPDHGLSLTQKIEQTGGDDWLLLVRNRVYASPVRQILMDAGLPFLDRTSTSGVPQSGSPRGNALRILRELHDGHVVRGSTLRLYIRQVYPGEWDNDTISWGKSYSLVDLATIGATPRLVKQIMEDPLATIRMEPYERRYLRNVLARHGWDAVLSKPRIEISTIHCSPGNEPIATKRGQIEIAALREDDRLISYVHETHRVVGGSVRGNSVGYPFQRSCREYQGPLITLQTSASKTRVTPNHRVLIAFDVDRYCNRWLVYLMRRGNWWRIGMTRTDQRPYVSGGIPGRLATEKGDAAWVISVHESRREACIAEAITQGRYGITGFPFQSNKNKEVSDADLAHIHSTVSEDLAPRAMALLADFGLLLEYPFYERRQGAYDSRRGFFLTAAANVVALSGRISLATIEPGSEWPIHRLASVYSQPYSGLVYGLDVPPYHHYVSGGAIVHNSSKGEEAKHVAVSTSMTRRTYNDYLDDDDSENRTFYVGATRAKESLTWVLDGQGFKL